MSLADSAGIFRKTFLEDLLRRGFEEAPRPDRATTALHGLVEVRLDDGSVRDEPIVVEVGSDFPYVRPKVKLMGGAGGLTWHQDRDGYLCLWPDDNSVADLPWKYADSFLDRVAQWVGQSLSNWEGDLPVLDLERYFAVDSSSVFLLPDSELEIQSEKFFQLTEHKGRDGKVRFEMKRYINSNPFILKQGRPHGKGGTYGAAVDVGTLDRPFGSWSDFDSLLRPGFAQTLMTAVSLGKVRVIVVQYRRENQVGQTAFLVSASSGVQILGALETVPTSQAVRRLRAGQGSDDLATKSVAVVGAGAVGSHVVDLLLRRGVGKVTVVDGESLRPGNAVRHLLARSEYELSDKATALRDHTSGYGFVPESAVTAERKRLLTISDAEELLRSHDLVVDATASGQASTLLADAASDSPAHLVIVALQRDGGIIRVDSFPGEGHADPLPENISGSVLLTEAGCIDPVSPVTPDAVVEAAVWAVRVAIDRLLGEGRFGPTVIVVNKEQPHPLYDRLGVIV